MLANVILAHEMRPSPLAVLDQPSIQPRRIRQFSSATGFPYSL